MSKKPQVWVTTVDNPFDPFTQWDRWFKFDVDNGYNTCARMAYLTRNSNDLSDAEYEQSIDDAIKTLIDWYAPNEVYRLAIEGKEQTFGRTKEKLSE